MDNEIILYIYNIINKMFTNDIINVIIKINAKLCVFSKEYTNDALLQLNKQNIVSIDNNILSVTYDGYQINIPFNAIIFIIDIENGKIINLNNYNNNIVSIYNISQPILSDLKLINDNLLLTFNKIYDYIISLSPDNMKININLVNFSLDHEDNENDNVVYIQCKDD